MAKFLAEQAEAHPTGPAGRAPAGRKPDGSIRYIERSFGELEAEASATAHYLVANQVERGTRVLLMVQPGLDLIRIVFALFKIGAVPMVQVNLRYFILFMDLQIFFLAKLKSMEKKLQIFHLQKNLNQLELPTSFKTIQCFQT